MATSGIESSAVDSSAPPSGWPDEVCTAYFRSTVDGTSQPMLVYTVPAAANAAPHGTRQSAEEKRPLLVALHTWSATYRQTQGQVAFRWCASMRWNFVHPHFRGPNWSAEACGSDLAVQDVLDAVSHIQGRFEIDEERVYAAGVSGGGHMALLLAGRAPGLWAGVSAWAAIADLRWWWKERADGVETTRRYARHIESAVGGRPEEENGAAWQECKLRSPLTYLLAAGAVNLDINAGVSDGWEGGAVPFTHSLYSYNAVVPPSVRLEGTFIDEFFSKHIPPGGKDEAGASKDRLYGEKGVLFRRMHRNVRVTVFRGGHEIIHVAALNWLAAQRRGSQAVWSPGTVPHLMDIGAEEGKSGK